MTEGGRNVAARRFAKRVSGEAPERLTLIIVRNF